MFNSIEKIALVKVEAVYFMIALFKVEVAYFIIIIIIIGWTPDFITMAIYNLTVKTVIEPNFIVAIMHVIVFLIRGSFALQSITTQLIAIEVSIIIKFT